MLGLAQLVKTRLKEMTRVSIRSGHEQTGYLIVMMNMQMALCKKACRYGVIGALPQPWVDVRD